MPEWISVSDRLPNVEEEVIGWFVSKYGNRCGLAMIGALDLWVFQEIGECEIQEGCEGKITHWQYFPDKPTAESVHIVGLTDFLKEYPMIETMLSHLKGSMLADYIQFVSEKMYPGWALTQPRVIVTLPPKETADE